MTNDPTKTGNSTPAAADLMAALVGIPKLPTPSHTLNPVAFLFDDDADLIDSDAYWMSD